MRECAHFPISYSSFFKGADIGMANAKEGERTEAFLDDYLKWKCTNNKGGKDNGTS